MKEEIWKEIKGFEGKYFISNHGRVKSIGGKYTLRHPDGYITLGSIDILGYRIVTLRKVTPENPRHKYRCRIHTLVATYFCVKPAGCTVVNHLDCDQLNNYFENLEWTTYLGNSRHAIKMGLFDKKGEKHHNAKLTKEKVLEMRRLRIEGTTYQKLGEIFGVERRHASDVVRGVNWGWLK